MEEALATGAWVSPGGLHLFPIHPVAWPDGSGREFSGKVARAWQGRVSFPSLPHVRTGQGWRSGTLSGIEVNGREAEDDSLRRPHRGAARVRASVVPMVRRLMLAACGGSFTRDLPPPCRSADASAPLPQPAGAHVAPRFVGSARVSAQHAASMRAAPMRQAGSPPSRNSRPESAVPAKRPAALAA